LSPQSIAFSIENYGWAAAEDARLEFRFQSHNRESSTEPTEIALGDIATVHDFTFESPLARFDVDVPALPDLGYGCTSEESGLDCVDRLRRSGVFGRLSDYLVVQKRRFGFVADGFIRYRWKEGDGRAQSATSPFHAFIPIGTLESRAECEGSDYEDLEDIGGGPFELRIAELAYRIPLPIRSTAPEGTVTRWRLGLEASKSSRHRLRVALQLADGRLVRSRDIDLLFFRPQTYPESIRPFQPRC
jgi:hypothetical protein